MKIYDRLLRPLFFRFDPETVHHLALAALAYTPIAAILGRLFPAPRQPIKLWGLEFRNPVGLAAGFDKDGVALDAWKHLGFGFVELGTVTRYPQPGNQRPRIFRIPEHRALINRMGFPNQGAEALARRLSKKPRSARADGFPVGINLGKSKLTPLEEAAEDYLWSFQKLYPWGDFFVVNVSSPNTPGLRSLQASQSLWPILSGLLKHNPDNKPILLKIAPDLTLPQLEDIITLIENLGLHGIVATNTTIDHTGILPRETGGLSGPPLKERATRIVREIHRLTGGRLPIIAVGGIDQPEDVQVRLDAGASLVEIYTSFIYHGPRVVPRLLAAESVPGRKG